MTDSPVAPELMTLTEVAELFRVSESTVYAWAQQGKVRGHKAGAQWRFWRDDVLRDLGDGPEAQS